MTTAMFLIKAYLAWLLLSGSHLLNLEKGCRVSLRRSLLLRMCASHFVSAESSDEGGRGGEGGTPAQFKST